MKDQMAHNDIIEEIRQHGSNYKADLPPKAWSSIESRLESNHTKKQISFYKIFYNAAIVVLIAGVFTMAGILLVKQNTQPVNTYAQNIQELSVNNNSYPVYNVHQLQKAYLKLALNNDSEQLIN